MGALVDAKNRRESPRTLAIAGSTKPTAPRMELTDDKTPTMIEVPPARIPEEPGAAILHAGICEDSVGQPPFLP